MVEKNQERKKETSAVKQTHVHAFAFAQGDFSAIFKFLKYNNLV
jgi:hypothetical protein